MYEDMTFEVILQRMLDCIPDTFDKREGSIIYDALAPAAAELQQVYYEFDRILDESFADTQSRDYLVRRAAERGVRPKEAATAIRQGEFNMDIPIGSRFSLGDLNFVVFEKIEDNKFKLACEEPGVIGNAASGQLMPIDYIEDLETAQLTDILIPGEDSEDTEVFRARYFDSLDTQAFGGNVADYKARTRGLIGVGGVKVVPVWNGPGTVKVIIIDSLYGEPGAELVEKVQNELDPQDSSGLGVGLAPIGHFCTVVGAQAVPINISTKITFIDDWDWAEIKSNAEAVIDDYFKLLTSTWGNTESLMVRLSQIETRLLDIYGVIDIADTTINGAPANIILSAEQIPVRGDINVN